MAFAAGAAQAEMKKEWVEYSHGDMKLKGYLAYDDKIAGRRPAILLIHDRAGMQPYTLAHTENWAKLGSAMPRASCPRMCRKPKPRWASTRQTGR